MSETAAPPDRLLAGRVAVVTGAARGIGRSIAQRLAEHGADVALLDLDESETKTAAVEVARSTGGRTVGLAADVTDAARMRTVADQIDSELGAVDVVVPNAGIMVMKPALEIQPAEFEAVLRVNLLGAFQTATEFAARMLAAEL